MIKRFLRTILIKYLINKKNQKLIKLALALYDEDVKIEDGEGLLIVPCDPETVTGSRGDEAMIQASITNFREHSPQSPIFIIAQGSLAEEFIKKSELGTNINVIPINDFSNLEKLLTTIRRLKPKEAVVIGADCVDGAYSSNLSILLISIFHILNKYGVLTRMTGFSFNSQPHKNVIKALKTIRSSKVYKVRDEFSYHRFRNVTNANCILIADAAFLLEPQPDFNGYKTINDWIEIRRNKGQKVIALNLHPMLRKYNNKDEIKNDAVKVAQNIKTIFDENPVINIILLPHDDRARINDGEMLAAIYNYLLPLGYSERLFYEPSVPRAKNIKAVVALVDGVVSSRMHLAIAALGSGIPVMGTDYQDKFQGLFAHFNLSDEFLLSIDEFFSEKFVSIFNQFFIRIPELKETVNRHKGKVIELAKQNFDDK